MDCTLEVVTPNFDGSSKGWRFYDPENDVTFVASVIDPVLLASVASGGQSFKAGDMIKVEMSVVRKTVTQRKRTERIITSVSEFVMQEN